MNFTSVALVFHIILDSLKNVSHWKDNKTLLLKMLQTIHYGPEVIILPTDVFCLAYTML